jgi:uncharacterized Zn-binding protein involved in type VI secretion
MPKMIVVDGDAVKGTDKHNVSGTGTITSPPGTAPYVGIADFDYVGKMTAKLSDFVTIGGKAVAVTTSESSLDPGEDAPAAGKHAGMNGKNFTPTTPTAIPPTISITDPIGKGVPGAAAGSGFVAIDGVKVVLDGDAIDTCDGLSIPGNSTVTSSQQDFVSCSE